MEMTVTGISNFRSKLNFFFWHQVPWLEILRSQNKVSLLKCQGDGTKATASDGLRRQVGAKGRCN